MKKLPQDFYLQDDVVLLSRQLLGKFLITDLNDEGITGGMIVETEAYAGITDKGSHAFNNRLTSRTKTMYMEGGVAYIYLIYGFYYLFNVVTNGIGIPHAVLIRAIEPTDGIDIMLKRRKQQEITRKLTGGPGVLTQALGITKEHNGENLSGNNIWIEDRGIVVPDEQIIESPRVNIAYAAEDALLPWRFRIKDNKWTSPAK
jgi:DNA-3-methyladenine glycosylase